MIINNLSVKGAEGMLLGCTEISMLVKQNEYALPLFDTTFLHAVDAIDAALL